MGALNIHTVNDSTDEPDGSITITLIPGSNYVIAGTTSVTITVRDNDGPIGSGSPPPTPVVSMGLASAGSEGDDVQVGISAEPKPASDLPVTITVSHTGGLLADSDAGKRTVTIPTSGHTSITIPTQDDEIQDENTVTITLEHGSGYTLGLHSTMILSVLDDDSGDGTRQDSLSGGGGNQQDTPTADAQLIQNVRSYAAETHEGQAHVDRWKRVLEAFGAESYDNLEPMTAAEGQTYVDRGWDRWIPVVEALKKLEA